MATAFEQQPREGAKAFAAFSLYLNMGPERSLEGVGRKLGKSARLMQRWSSRWKWAERVDAHAAHLATVEREAVEVVARTKAAEWAKRQDEVRQGEWVMHEKCIGAAKKAFDAFMAREKVYANLADIARMLEVASKLGRLASGLATDKTEVTGEDGGAIRVEFEAALKKVYGRNAEKLKSETLKGEVVEVEEIGKQKTESRNEGQGLLTSAATEDGE